MSEHPAIYLGSRGYTIYKENLETDWIIDVYLVYIEELLKELATLDKGKKENQERILQIQRELQLLLKKIWSKIQKNIEPKRVVLSDINKRNNTRLNKQLGVDQYEKIGLTDGALAVNKSLLHYY